MAHHISNANVEEIMSHQSLKKDQSSLAIVTGGTSGIGLALAQGFAEKGYEVTSVGLGEMPKNQERIEFHPMDVRSQESIKNLLKTHDHLDVLVNAAGAIRREEELKPEVFETIVDINLNGTMRMCAECRPLLAQSRGSIINIASMYLLKVTKSGVLSRHRHPNPVHGFVLKGHTGIISSTNGLPKKEAMFLSPPVKRTPW